jgi:hypothetical protein
VTGAWTIYRRELAGLFLSPLAWVLLALALAFNGFFFVVSIKGFQGDISQSMSFLLGGSYTFWMLVVLLPPLLTMRMFSEEARRCARVPADGAGDRPAVAPASSAPRRADGGVVVESFFYGLSRRHSARRRTDRWRAVLGAILVSALFCSVGLR